MHLLKLRAVGELASADTCELTLVKCVCVYECMTIIYLSQWALFEGKWGPSGAVQYTEIHVWIAHHKCYF